MYVKPRDKRTVASGDIERGMWQKNAIFHYKTFNIILFHKLPPYVTLIKISILKILHLTFFESKS